MKNVCTPEEEKKLNQTQVVNLWAIPSGVGQPGLLGRSLKDKWVPFLTSFLSVSNNVYSDHNRWMIQVPRLYDIYRCFDRLHFTSLILVFRTHNSVDNFQDILKCLFQVK